MKTVELCGVQLDYAVATLEGYSNLRMNPHRFAPVLIMDPPHKKYGVVQLADLDYSSAGGLAGPMLADLDYSSAWGLAGPIIEREKITISPNDSKSYIGQEPWTAYRVALLFTDEGEKEYMHGPTPLIAAMRCYVASKMGEEINIPEELS